MQDGHQFGIFQTKSESLINRARNQCASVAITSQDNYDKLLFIDADIGFEYSDIQSLIASDKAIIGGAYPLKKYPISFNFNPLESDLDLFNGFERTYGDIGKLVERHATKEVRVKNIGTGFLMIDCNVLRVLSGKVPSYEFHGNGSTMNNKNWDFFPSGVLGNSYLSEDYYFEYMALLEGYGTYLHSDVILSHFGGHSFKTGATNE